MSDISAALVIQVLTTVVGIGVFVGYVKTQFTHLDSQIQEIKATQILIQNLSERMAVVEKCTDHNARDLADLRGVVDRRRYIE